MTCDLKDIMLNIFYTEHVTNEELIRKTNVNRKLLSEIVKSHVKFFGHVERINQKPL